MGAWQNWYERARRGFCSAQTGSWLQAEQQEYGENNLQPKLLKSGVSPSLEHAECPGGGALVLQFAPM